jgi:hypothetical protein
MSQKVTITKNKINGLLESQVTQPTDGVPLSMLNDLSGSIAIDISNLETQIYDLSYYVYNDLSGSIAIDISNLETQIYDLSYYVYNDLSGGGGGAGEINIGTYTDTSTTIFPNVTTLLFDASSFTLDLSGTSTIKIDVDVSGGSGEVTYSDLSYLLFDNPLISTNPQNSSTSSQVNLSWTPPTQTKSAFNFIDGGLATMNNTYSFLPYISDIWIKYKDNTTSSYPVMGSSAILGQNSGAFKYSQITTNNQRLTNVNKLSIKNTGTGSPTATLLGGANTDTIELDLTTGAIGGTYSYKIAYVNNSEDISWNYLTFGGQSFGNPGPANPPLSLSFTNITYSSLTVGGLGAAPPPGTGTGMDASLNLPYGTPNFFVGYGVDISGVKRTGAIQVGGNVTPVPVTDISVGFPNTQLVTSQAWSKNIDSLAAYPEYIINTINTPTKRYYAVNSSPDFSNRDISNVTDASAVAYIPIPTRSEAVTGTDYTTDINTKSFLNPLPTPTPTGGSITASPRKRGDVSIQITPVEFLSDLSSISYNSTDFYKLIANFGDTTSVVPPPTWVNSGSYLGSDASGIPLTQFKVDISNGTGSSASSGPSLSSSLISGVWTQGSNTSVSNSNISFSHSTTIPQGSGQLKEGYYLGVDLSSIKIDISLGSFPDICNNIPEYSSYKASVTQILKKDSGLSDQVGTTTAALFNIGKTPLNDTSVANYTITIFNPSYPSNNFWGLKLPTASGTGTTGGELVFKVDATINDLDQTWAPSDGQQAGSLYDLSLIYNPTSSGSVSSMPIENMEKSWEEVETGAPASVALSEVMEMNYTDDYTNSNINFSRDVSGAPQFGISFTLKNNITRTPQPAVSKSNTTDLSGIDGKNWWWDFTWDISAPSTSFPSTFLPPITDITSTIPTLMELVNVFDISSGQSTLTGYDHTNSINYNTAMWAKNGFYGAGLSSNVDLSGVQPYIDYNIYSGQGPSNVNYQIYDSSGITQSISYSPTVFYSNNAVPVTSSYTNLKFIIIRLSNSETSAPKSSYFIKCDILGVDNTLLTLGTDYCLFYQEEQQSTSGSAVYQWTSPTPNQYFSPWLDCANRNLSSTLNTFQQGQAATTNGSNNGNYDSSKSTYHIRRIAQSQAIYQYLAIGIQNGKTIGKVTISYGSG